MRCADRWQMQGGLAVWLHSVDSRAQGSSLGESPFLYPRPGWDLGHTLTALAPVTHVG